MNRHHPYGGYDGSRRGGGSPQGLGPDRHPRFGRTVRGGRGRGGATSFYDSGDYDDGSGYNSPQGYNVNGTGQEDPFYFQGQQLGVPPTSFSSPSGYGVYDEQHQGYGGGMYEGVYREVYSIYLSRLPSLEGLPPVCMARVRMRNTQGLSQSLYHESLWN